MRKIHAAAVILAALMLASCAKGSGEVEETTAAKQKDWHNSIEYEGSFYVNETTKLLYSLDRGTVTLWDDKGNGNELQTLKYDTLIDDAMERIEFFDENFDSNTDIKILYDEADGKYYNLWLWNENKGMFDMCTRYKEIRNPEPLTDEGVVVSTANNGIFGTINKKYCFDEHMNILLSSAIITDESAVADTIAAKLSLGSTTPAENIIKIDKNDCTAFITKDASGATTGYLAYNSDGAWYADMGALGFYRSLGADGDSILLGDYTEETGQVQKAAAANFDGDIAVIYKTAGAMGGSDANRYTVTADGQHCCYIVTANQSFWYISTDGESYSRLNKNTWKIEDDVNDVFQPAND